VKKRSILVSAVLVMVTCAMPVSAQEKRVYSVLSLIGDRLDIVIAQPQTGTRIDPNRRETLPIDGAVFDNTAARAIAASVQKISAAAELHMLNTRSPVLFNKHRELFAQSGDRIAMPDAIKEALKGQGATHLFLVTKIREDAANLFAGGTIDGKGKLEGLGFYIDGSMTTRDTASGAKGRGFMAPFAYFNVAVIELANAKVLKQLKATATRPVSAGAAKEDRGSPWAALSAAEKVSLVNELIEEEIARIVPELLK
jgi:hypothetical protein